MGRAKGGGAPLHKNFSPLNCPKCPPKLALSLQQFQDGGFFDWRSTENEEKSRPIWRDDPFFWINRELGEDKTNPKILPPQAEILPPPPPPLEQRFSCGTGPQA